MNNQYSDYMFNQTDRIGSDRVDNTQQNLQNTRFSTHMLANYFSDTTASKDIQFATSYPTMNFSGTVNGNGLNGQVIDYDSLLNIQAEQARPLEKLSLNARPFVSIPYLGRGTCNPDLESQLLQGESVFEKKGVSTIMDKSFLPYSLYMVTPDMDKHVQDPAIEESTLEGWARGGTNTRTTGVVNK